ncbi:MAG: transposase [Ectobacillus sp.]
MTRTKHSKEFKLQVVKEATETGNQSIVARRYNLNPKMVSRWCSEYKNGKLGDVDVAVLPDFDTKERVTPPKLDTF